MLLLFSPMLQTLFFVRQISSEIRNVLEQIINYLIYNAGVLDYSFFTSKLKLQASWL
jgi:hypothetical protein